MTRKLVFSYVKIEIIRNGGYMKKVFLILFSILLLGTINVNAEEEYNIVVDENNNFTLTDSGNNQITDNTIAKHEENTIILGENKYFNQIIIKSDAIITSNDKEVYIKELTTQEGNNYLLANINIKNLKVGESDNYVCKIDVGGNLIVNDSEINTKTNQNVKGYTYYINSKFKSSYSMNSVGRDDDGFGFKIINSNLNMDSSSFSQIYPQNGGFYAKDSTITGSKHRISGYGDLYIENSNIAINYLTQQTATGKTTIKDSKIKSPQQIALFSRNDEQSAIFQNSEIESGEIYASKIGLIIDNCTIKSSSDISTGGDISINNSKVYVKSFIQPFSNQRILKFNIENSEVEVGYFYTSGYGYSPAAEYSLEDNTRLYAKNSKIKTTTTSSTLFGDSVFENCELNFEKLIHVYNDLSIINSTGVLSGITMIDNNLMLENSLITFSNENGFNANYSPLSLKNDLVIKNSNIILDNTKNDKKPVLIQGNIILDDKIISVDQEKTKLKVKELDNTEEERAVCRSCFADNKPIFSFAYENETFTNYVKLATQKTAIFKVKNGNWPDGTNDDIIIDYLYG